MKTMNFLSLKSLTLTGALAFTLSVRASIVGPYTPDANTLHLFHLDESTVPCTNAVPGGFSLTAISGGAALGSNAYSGFGAAVSTYDGGPELFSATNIDAAL